MCGGLEINAVATGRDHTQAYSGVCAFNTVKSQMST